MPDWGAVTALVCLCAQGFTCVMRDETGCGTQGAEEGMMKYISILALCLVLVACQRTVDAYNAKSEAERVSSIQSDLEELGHNPGPVDGKLGNQTRIAIREFQSANGLPVTGEIDSTLYSRAGVISTSVRRGEGTYSPKTGYAKAQPVQKASSYAGGALIPVKDEASTCGYANWGNGTIENLADLFDCDRAKSIALLAKGQSILFQVQSVGFEEGKFLAAMSASNSLVHIASRRGSGNELNRMYTLTQTPKYRIICSFAASKAESVKQGSTITVKAKLRSLDGTDAEFDCS